MCMTCALTQTFDPNRHESGEAVFADIVEGVDAAADISTTYSMEVGDTFSGEISTGFERDWIAITLEAGETYVIDQLGTVSGGGTLSDAYLRLYDSNGLQLAFNDDGGAGFEAQIVYTAQTTGTFYIAAGAYSSRTGTYRVEVNTSAPPDNASIDELALQLSEGYWGDREITWNNGVEQ